MSLLHTNRALLLDRDGVINVDHGYVHEPESFEFMPGIFDFCREAHKLGFVLVVVTNQAGIGRGYYTEEAFAALSHWMLEQFASVGAPIARVYHCPTHPTAGQGHYRADSPRRKPAPGMIFDARDDLQLDLGRSALIGDKPSDVQAAHAAGVGLRMLLGPSPLPADRLPPDTRQVPDLRAATVALRVFAADGQREPL
jgi:D-glycero-D-manno-heptose 1,7-bisphosphate phosphatase